MQRRGRWGRREAGNGEVFARWAVACSTRHRPRGLVREVCAVGTPWSGAIFAEGSGERERSLRFSERSSSRLHGMKRSANSEVFAVEAAGLHQSMLTSIG